MMLDEQKKQSFLRKLAVLLREYEVIIGVSCDADTHSPAVMDASGDSFDVEKNLEILGLALTKEERLLEALKAAQIDLQDVLEADVSIPYGRFHERQKLIEEMER